MSEAVSGKGIFSVFSCLYSHVGGSGTNLSLSTGSQRLFAETDKKTNLLRSTNRTSFFRIFFGREKQTRPHVDDISIVKNGTVNSEKWQQYCANRKTPRTRCRMENSDHLEEEDRMTLPSPQNNPPPVAIETFLKHSPNRTSRKGAPSPT